MISCDRNKNKSQTMIWMTSMKWLTQIIEWMYSNNIWLLISREQTRDEYIYTYSVYNDDFMIIEMRKYLLLRPENGINYNYSAFFCCPTHCQESKSHTFFFSLFFFLFFLLENKIRKQKQKLFDCAYGVLTRIHCWTWKNRTRFPRKDQKSDLAVQDVSGWWPIET